MSQPDSRKPLIEIGIVAASLDAVALTAVEQAANRLWQRLANVMEQFEWRIAIAPCDECGSQDSVEPMTLLDLAQQQPVVQGGALLGQALAPAHPRRILSVAVGCHVPGYGHLK